ncbi:MAG: universal stress protein [Haloferacaceae archaeon]
MYETVLVPTDGSEGAAAAVERAVDLARTYGATLHALYVVDVRMSPVTTDMDHDTVVELVEESGEPPTRTVIERAEAAGVPAVEAIRPGVPHKTIREYAAERGIDLVVVGTHGRTGLERYLLGSVTERLLRTVDAPVLTVPLPTDGE